MSFSRYEGLQEALLTFFSGGRMAPSAGIYWLYTKQ